MQNKIQQQQQQQWVSRDITVIHSFINQTICHNHECWRWRQHEEEEKEDINNTTTHSTAYIEFETYQFYWSTTSKRYNYQEYSFGITTIILRKNEWNESTKARNWINGVNEIQGLKGSKNRLND